MSVNFEVIYANKSSIKMKCIRAFNIVIKKFMKIDNIIIFKKCTVFTAFLIERKEALVSIRAQSYRPKTFDSYCIFKEDGKL